MISIGQFGNGIRQHFRTKPDKFLWKQGLLIYGKIMIDIFYFEDWLAQHSRYDADKSIRENIVNLYGEEAARWVESVL